MTRATRIVTRGHWNPVDAVDRVTLDHDARHRRRFQYVAEGGTAFLLDLPRAQVLSDGDALRLDDGRLVVVVAADEPLIEVTAPDVATLMRLAWHIGNRHLAADLQPDRIRLLWDHVIADMLRGLGGTVARIEAPFVPEQGAYAAGGRGHEHHHHDHDDGHHHHH